MIGGWMWLAQWAREIERKRDERAEQRGSSRKRHLRRLQAGGQRLRRIELTADEKEKLRAKISEQAQKTTHSKKMKTAICVYMAIMISGVMGFALILFIHKDIAYPTEAVENMVSCLIVIAFCVLWLKLSNIRKSRSLSAKIPGIILFVLGSGLVAFGVAPLRRESVIVSLLLGTPALVASYFLCFSEGENTDILS